MTARSNRLRRLLDLRRRQEQQTRGQLAESLRLAGEISEEVKERSEALEAVLRGTERARSETVEAISDAAMIAISSARAAEASAIAAAGEMRRTWDRALQRVDGLERLEERAEDVRRDAERRAEASAIDDVVARRAGGKDDQ